MKSTKAIRGRVFNSAPVFRPDEDGKTHINIYSRDKTELGTLLSNFACTLFATQYDGQFYSVEGYIYWLQTEAQHRDDLRYAYGWTAKRIGRELRKARPSKISPKRTSGKVEAALHSKISKHTHIQSLLVESQLPLTHYYVKADGTIIPRLERMGMDN